MTATSISQMPAPGAPRGDVRRPSFALLTYVELRKMVDTRAGRVLLAVILLGAVLVLGFLLFNAGKDNLQFEDWVGAANATVALLLPVLGVLAMSSEWTQRTVLTTFTLTPRRARVLSAKLVAAAVLGLVVTVVADLLATATLVVRATVVGGSVTWGSVSGVLAGSVVTQALGLLMGAALGALIMHTAGAIVAYYVVPNAAMIAGSLVFEDGVRWFNIAEAFSRLSRFDLEGQVGPTVTSVLIWVVLPLAVGFWRSLRRNVS